MDIGSKGDFDIKSYFTPYFVPGFGATQGWKRPYELAYLNIANFPPDTQPAYYQYVAGSRFENGLRIETPLIEVSKHLTAGSTAKIVMVTKSDRDVFEISDNEVTNGHMIPHFKFPYHAWEINLKSASDADFPSPVMFRGMLVDVPSQTFGDVKDSMGDGLWRFELNFESFDAGMLRGNRWAPLYYHRAQGDTNQYHMQFTAADQFTFDTAITEIVKWMNQSRPTTDFPFAFSYTEKAEVPYNYALKDPESIADNLSYTTSSATVTRATGDFTKEVIPGYKIRRTVDGNAWYTVGSIVAGTEGKELTLTSVYTGTTGSGASQKLPNDPIISVEGNNTWDILIALLNHMGIVDIVEGLGKKYIPTCSVAGVIDIALGGFDKTHTVDEDFRSTQGMQKDTSTDMTIWFNLISVPFFVGGVLGNNDAEYWIKFTLYRWNAGTSSWDTVTTIPSSGYEYVPFDTNNTHGRKYYSFPTQEFQPENTYKWNAELVTSGSFIIGATDGYAFSPPSYSHLNSSTRIDYRKLRTFLVSQGLCSEYGGYDTATTGGLMGCKDGGLITNGGYGKCVDYTDNKWRACYPDPHLSNATTLTGNISITSGSPTITGASTLFTTELYPGCLIKRTDTGADWFTVKKINSDTSLTLTSNATITSYGAGSKREGFHGDYGILSDITDPMNTHTLSDKNSWNTLCRLHSKRVYECHLNTGNKIRAPVEFTVTFNDGWTTDLVGAYLELYCVELDDMIIGRCIEQTHTLEGGRLKTVMTGFRV